MNMILCPVIQIDLHSILCFLISKDWKVSNAHSALVVSFKCNC